MYVELDFAEETDFSAHESTIRKNTVHSNGLGPVLVISVHTRFLVIR